MNLQKNLKEATYLYLDLLTHLLEVDTGDTVVHRDVLPLLL